MLRKTLWIAALSLLASSTRAEAPSPTRPATQISLARVELMPDEPPGFKLLDFQAIARGYDAVVFGPNSMLMWRDDTRINIPFDGVGLPTYVDHPEMKGGNNHEAITVLGSILGATMAGMDKRNGEVNFAAASAQYFNSANGSNLVLNRTSTPTGQSYWYELFPQILFDAIAVRYPQEPQLAELSHQATHRWMEAFEALSKEGTLSFEHTAFDFDTMRPVDNGKHHEPDASAALAYLFYNEFVRTGEPKYLDAANACLSWLQSRPTSPSYEVLMPFGAYTAARMNAETDSNQDVARLLNDYFEPRSDARTGWGLVVGNWNGIEVSGLIGSVTDAGGYGFVMNTYASAMAIVPIARYDERYATSIGKWVLNAAGAIRYCYPGQLPVENTSRPAFKSEPANVIAFEGIRRRYAGKSPFAGGDPTIHGWGPSDLSLYGSGLAGVFGGMIRPTSDPLVLQVDLLSADPAGPKGFPTHLYYNPHPQPTSITVPIADGPVDLYESIENRMVVRGAQGSFQLQVPPQSARILVQLPSGAQIVNEGRRSRVGETVFDFENGLLPARALPPAKPVVSKAKRVLVPKASPVVDGKIRDWQGRGSQRLRLTTHGRGELEADVSFAWDAEHLYVLVQQVRRSRDTHEAADAAKLSAAPWDFDGVSLYIDLGNGQRATVGDFVLNLGFGSAGQRNLSFSPQSPDDGSGEIESICAGSVESGDRIIEARVQWNEIATASFRTAKDFHAAPATTIGCEPLLIEKNHTRQSFLGGAQYRKPNGADPNSIDLVLSP